MGIESFFCVKKLVKEYCKGEQILRPLNDVSFDVKRGEIVVIVGASGAGKSTLLHIMGLLDKPTKGSVYLDNVNLTALSEKEQAEIRSWKIGFIFQFYHLLPEFTAFENIVISRMIISREKKHLKLFSNLSLFSGKDSEDARYLLNAVGLSHRMDHLPNELSGGECQRVAVARALVNRPDIVLCDEPTGNLDEKNSREIRNLIWKFNQEFNQTFIIVTHDERISTQAHRVFRMRDGVIVD